MDASDPDPQPPDSAPPDSVPPSSVPAVRYWPPNEDLDPDSSLAAQCTGCGAPWRIHRDMSGFKLRCSCGTYIEVPRLPAPAPPIDALVAADESRDIMLVPEITEDEQGRIELASKTGQVLERDMPVSAPMAPGTVQKGNVVTQQRWTNAAFLELALMMAAFLLPGVAISLIFDGQAQTLAMPFASLITGIVVVMVAAAMSPFAFSGLRRAPPRFFVEAVAVAGVTFLLAQGYMHLVDTEDEGGAMLRALRTALGTGWFLFVLSFTPAVFEEIAFRGVVQGRFYALLGRFQGMVATGAAFGLCHGITGALPFHVGIGVYLCWLRERSASLWPCMLMHATYNAAIGLSA